MTTNNTFSNQNREENNTFCNLTEQWKKGELPSGWYYYKSSILGNITIADSFTLHKYRNRLDWKDIITVLTPVPSYEEWQQMKAFCEEFNALNVAEENQRLKSLLKDLRKLIGNNFLNHEMRILLNEIDEVLYVSSK